MSAWRTVLVLCFLALVMLAGLWICRGAGDVGAKLFPDLSYALLGFAFVQAGKSSVQALAGGGGVKGAIAALMTSAKPESPPAPPAPP